MQYLFSPKRRMLWRMSAAILWTWLFNAKFGLVNHLITDEKTARTLIETHG